jgi:hypothetical protein
MIAAAGWLALASVPEVFVVLWATQAGLAIKWVPLVWAAASLVKMVIALPAGVVSDRLGRTPVLLCGWATRVVVLLLLAFVQAPSAVVVWALFVAYSATLAVTEPAERSLIGDHAAATERARFTACIPLADRCAAGRLSSVHWQAFGSQPLARRQPLTPVLHADAPAVAANGRLAVARMHVDPVFRGQCRLELAVPRGESLTRDRDGASLRHQPVVGDPHIHQ